MKAPLRGQLSLMEQGYSYEILDERDILPAKRQVG